MESAAVGEHGMRASLRSQRRNVVHHDDGMIGADRTSRGGGGSGSRGGIEAVVGRKGRFWIGKIGGLFDGELWPMTML